MKQIQIFAGILSVFGMVFSASAETSVQLGPRPFFLVNDMDEGPLKDQLKAF